MKSILKLMMMSVLLCGGCDHVVPGNLPNTTPASQLPVFAGQENEIEIADSFNNTDPSMVLGALVDRTNGRVHSFNTFLKEDATTEKKTVAESFFRDFMENSVVAEAEWLSFLKGRVNDSTRAEVTVTEASNASVGASSIDRDKLQEFAQEITQDQRDDYGVVIAYRDFVITATLFREQGIEGSMSGYGAKIGGKWFGKHENTSAEHRVVAVWSPLPFVLQKTVAGSDAVRGESLRTLTQRALTDRSLRIKPLDRRGPFRLLRTAP